jgi:hypothetical protein
LIQRWNRAFDWIDRRQRSIQEVSADPLTSNESIDSESTKSTSGRNRSPSLLHEDDDEDEEEGDRDDDDDDDEPITSDNRDANDQDTGRGSPLSEEEGNQPEVGKHDETADEELDTGEPNGLPSLEEEREDDDEDFPLPTSEL